MNWKQLLATLTAGVALTASADTDWMVLPRYTKTGMTLLHGCRNSPKRMQLKLHYVKSGKDGKFRYLAVGNQGGFRFGGVNERGVAVIFTGGGPMVTSHLLNLQEQTMGR